MLFTPFPNIKELVGNLESTTFGENEFQGWEWMASVLKELESKRSSLAIKNEKQLGESFLGGSKSGQWFPLPFKNNSFF